MSNYIKKYNVGNIKLDLPSNSFIHELPLLSFSDFRNSVNISLVYNHKLKQDNNNMFNIGIGFKLNIQKRIIKDINNKPYQLIDSNGKYIQLINNLNYPEGTTYNNIYTFDDESKRILRINSNGYEIENEDFSKEVYNSLGDILEIYDKYGDIYLRFEYNNNLLSEVVYNGKTVEFKYVNDVLESMSYGGTITKFTYYNPNLTIIHYTGVRYYMTITDNLYSVSGRTIDESNLFSKSKECSFSDNVITLTSKVGTDVVDTMTYIFPSIVTNGYQLYNQVEVINKNGVKQRIQFINKIPLCSYEIKNITENDNENDDIYFCDDMCACDVNVYKTINYNIINSFTGTMKYNDGVRMTKDPIINNRYHSDVTRVYNSDTKGSFLLTGWIKSIIPNSNNTIGVSNISQGNTYEFIPSLTEQNKWYFFSFQFELDANSIYVQASQTGVELKDLRITYMLSHIIDDNDVSHSIYQEDILIEKNTEEMIPFNKVNFYSLDINNEKRDITLSFSDILRYIRNSLRLNNEQKEIYYENSKKVMNNCLDIFVKKKDSDDYISISQYYIGHKYYKNEDVYYSRLKIFDTSPLTFLNTNYKNGDVYYSYQYLNEFYDVSQSTEDGMTTYYTRDKGLLTRETDDLRDLKYTYNTENNTMVVKDLYGEGNILSGITYYMDPTWGTVYKEQTVNGTTIKDTYDDDMSTILEKEFNKQSVGIKHLYGYNEGSLSSLSCDDLNYNFDYTKNKLSKVSKFDSVIEEQAHTDNTTTIYYPNRENTIYNKEYYYDKYDRLTDVMDELEYEYNINSSFDNNTGDISYHVGNSSAKLVLANDKITNRKARFYYNNQDLLIKKEVTSSTNYQDVISNETFTYDSAKRLKEKEFTYDKTNNLKVKDQINYVKEEDSPLIDERVSSSKYYINNNEEPNVTSSYEYDLYKRLNKKTYVFKDGVTASKSLCNNQNKIVSETSNINNDLKPTTTYTYDLFDRILIITLDNKTIKYEYDDYGRLVREDNQPLDKTIVYGYNKYGNIITNSTYQYSPNTNPTTLSSSKSYTYDSTYKDRLVSFNGTTIPYNTLGCPTQYNGYNLTWTKGKLTKLAKGNVRIGTESCTYVYNAYGQRVSKVYSKKAGNTGISSIQVGDITNYDKTYSYDHSGRLINEKGTVTYYGDGTYDQCIEYIYDVNTIIGIKYTHGTSTNTYYFDRNIFGDVVSIYDSHGNLKVKYLYDSFGNCTISSETTDNALARVNPIRYRGYYYDVETGWFWLSSRYYSPELCRFISPDDVSYLDPESVNGLNLYCYCLNNPISYCDPSGHFAVSALIIGAIIGAVVGFGIAGYIDYQDDGQIFNGSVKWYDYLGATVLGGVIGAGLGAFASMSFSATIPTGFAMVQTTAGTTAIVVTSSLTLTASGAQILGAAGLIGATYMFSKHNPGMTNKPPFSWTTNQEGMDAMIKFGGDANKAADYIMNNHFDNWKYGAGQARNAIKKWLDRVIRKMLGM